MIFQKNNLHYVFVLFIIFHITYCATSSNIRTEPLRQKTKVSIKKISFVNISLKDLKLKLHLQIFNPHIIGVKINSFRYVIEAEGDKLASGEQKDLLHIKPKENTSVTVPVTIEFSGVPEIIKGFFKKQSINYLVKAVVGLRFIGSTSIYIPIRKKGTLKLPDRKTLWNKFKDKILPFWN